MTTCMYNKNEYENPFKSTNADSMSYEQIVDSWSIPFFMRRKTVSEDYYLTLPSSLIISGARGTGKTMMLKYYSFQAQTIIAKKKNISLIEYFMNKKSISFYLKFDPYILQAFSEDEMGEIVFTHLFELVICQSYIELLNEMYVQKSLADEQFQAINDAIYHLLGECGEYDELEKIVIGKIDEVYDYISEKKLYGAKFNPKRVFRFKSLSYKIKELFCDYIPEWENIAFLWVIDEGENFLEFEQKIMNAIIKTLNARQQNNIYIRLGTRSASLETHESINEEEVLIVGRDYEIKDINFYTISTGEREDYKNWLLDIAKNRLAKVEVFAIQNLLDIRKFLGEKENQEDEARRCVGNKTDHFSWMLKSQFNDQLYEELKVDNYPLLEMMNIWWYKKGYTIEEIRIGLNGYLYGSSKNEENIEIEKRYKETFLRNKVSFLYLLLFKYKNEKQYYSFNTFSYLSISNVYTFIRLCREAFENAYFEDKEKLILGMISIKAQHRAAMSVAFDDIEKVKYIPKLGNQLFALVVNIGNLFSEYHSDVELRMMETNQFSVLEKKEYTKELIRAALKWGVFLKKNTLQTLDSSGRKGYIYTLNKAFCPLFGISYRSNGRYKEVFSEELFLELTTLQKKRITNLISEYSKGTLSKQIPGQISLFGEDDCASI